MDTVAIIGTGLIGSSFGLALRKAGFGGAILGVSSPGAIDGAVARGAVDRGASLEDALAAADVVFLAQKIGRILDRVRHIDSLLKPGALVTDAGSTKCEIVDAARGAISRGQFLGGHPMAGKETSGPDGADADLFRGRPWVLTPDDPSELETPAARDFRGWLDRIGARTIVLDADEHDRIVARTSHLPQLASTALGALLSDAARVEISGSGLLDMTRLALSSYDLWRDILATNSEHIEKALAQYILELEHLRENLRTRQLQEEFEKGARLAKKLRPAV
jgi:prephenate dehydrogenase